MNRVEWEVFYKESDKVWVAQDYHYQLQGKGLRFVEARNRLREVLRENGCELGLFCGHMVDGKPSPIIEKY